MANTRYLRVQVEKYVREQLTKRFGQPFHAKVLQLVTGGDHEFDAVSDDGAIVATVKAASGLTSGGKIPQGKINTAVAELYFLSLVEAQMRMLVLTTPAFHSILARRMRGRLASGIEIECIPLPATMQAEYDRVILAASKEMSPQIAAQVLVEEEEDE